MRPRRILAPLLVLASLLGFGALSAVAPAAAVAAAAPAATTGWVRCANLSAGSPAVDIYLLAFGNSANPTVLRAVSYGDVSSYMPVAVGQYTVAMRPVGASASSPSDRLRQLHGERRLELHGGQPRACRGSVGSRC